MLIARMMSGYMPRGPNVAISLCGESNAKQDWRISCVRATLPGNGLSCGTLRTVSCSYEPKTLVALDPRSARTTETEAPGQPPGARDEAQTRQRRCAGP